MQVNKQVKMVDGKDVMRLTGLKPGPEVGKVITQTTAWILDNDIEDKEEIEQGTKIPICKRRDQSVFGIKTNRNTVGRKLKHKKTIYMMKKICKGCGRNRRLGKVWSAKEKPDGKNIRKHILQGLYESIQISDIKNPLKVVPFKKIVLKKICKGCGRNRLKYKESEIKTRSKNTTGQYYIKNKTRILYNKKCREETECVMIFDEKPQKPNVKKINKVRKVDTIIINPMRK
jgi:predicted Fe-S protein YdhL (DUF1289 family)